MKNNLLVGFGALLIVCAIVGAIFIRIKIGNDSKDTSNSNEEVNVYEENEISNNEQSSSSEVKEIITSEEIKKEYEEKLNLNSKIINAMINSKSEFSKDGSIISFNSGVFSDEEKYQAIKSKVLENKQVNIYDDSALVDIDELKNISNDVFYDNIDITKLDEVTIRKGKIVINVDDEKVTYNRENLKVKSLTENEMEKIYTLVFEWSLADVRDNINPKYNTLNMRDTFELKYDLVNKKVIELNKK